MSRAWWDEDSAALVATLAALADDGGEWSHSELDFEDKLPSGYSGPPACEAGYARLALGVGGARRSPSTAFAFSAELFLPLYAGRCLPPVRQGCPVPRLRVVRIGVAPPARRPLAIGGVGPFRHGLALALPEGPSPQT